MRKQSIRAAAGTGILLGIVLLVVSGRYALLTGFLIFMNELTSGLATYVPDPPPPPLWYGIVLLLGGVMGVLLGLTLIIGSTVWMRRKLREPSLPID